MVRFVLTIFFNDLLVEVTQFNICEECEGMGSGV